MNQYSPPPPAPGHGPQQQYPGQWYGHAPPPVKKPAPITALSRLGIILVVLLLAGGLLEGAAWLLPRLVESSLGQWIALGLSLVYVVILLAILGVALACIIVGIVAVVRLPSGGARTGALLLVIAAAIGSSAVSSGASGDGLPQAVLIGMAVLRGLGALIAIGLAFAGLVQLRGDSSSRRL